MFADILTHAHVVHFEVEFTLLKHPRIGEHLDEFEPREVRRILVGGYEMRCEIQEAAIYVLRLWHTR